MNRANRTNRVILIMAGGTGGHIMPGLAVADLLRTAGWDVFWLGVRGGMEERLVPARGFQTTWIRARAFRGKGFLAKLLLPVNLIFAFLESALAIFRLRPDVVLGMGGYVAFPGGVMAFLLARPLVLHEQNAIPGLSNRLLARFADKLMVGFPGVLRNSEWTGNPVNVTIGKIPSPDVRLRGRHGPLNLLVLGGSLGAAALNEVLPIALAYIPQSERPRVVHQAGVQHIEALRQGYAAAGVEGELVPFIDDMASRYAAADLVVCRAGAMTIAELCAAGLASVLVPFPFAVDDHQSANARFLSVRGAAILLPQKDLTAGGLAQLLRTIDRETIFKMARAARSLGKPDAARTVASQCMALAGMGA